MPINYGNVVSGSAAVPAGTNGTFFYCRITGFLVPTITGSYTIGVNCGDGCSLFIGPQSACLIDGIDDANVPLSSLGYGKSAKIDLTAGQFYPFVIEWQHGGSGDYELQLIWTPPGGTMALVPDASLSDIAGAVSQRVNASFGNGTSTYWYPTGEGSSSMTTEGDLLVGNADGIPDRLAIGANATVLTSDGTTASWQAPGGGGGGSVSFGSGAPSGGSPSDGDLYFDTSASYAAYVFKSSAWHAFGSGGGGGGGGFSSGSNSSGLWVQDPTGALRQWGRVTTDINGSTESVTFPVAFASGSAAAGKVSVVVATRSSTDRITYVVDSSVTDSGFTVGNNGSSGFADWEASGPGSGTGTSAVSFGSGAPSGSSFDGALYFDTSATPYAGYVYKSGAWHAEGGSGGSGPSITVPPLTGWTWDVQGSSAIDTSSGAYIEMDAAQYSSGIRAYYRTPPSTPYTITAMFSISYAAGQDIALDFGFRDSGGKYVLIHFSDNGNLYAFKFSSSNSPTADYLHVSRGLPTAPLPVWLRIADDGTNITFSYGVQPFIGGPIAWVSLYSGSRTDYMSSGPDAVMWGSYTNGGATSVWLGSWLET